jgi:hypothetical protein
MAKTFLTNINLKGNQLLNAVIHSASSAPSALAAGQLYFNTGDSTFYYSTGTGTGNWSPVGVQYISAVGTNLSVTDGQLDISSTPTFTTISLNQDGTGHNILVGNDAYIGDVNVSNHIAIIGNEDATKAGILLGSNLTEAISSNATDLTLSSNNDIILLPGSDYAYIGMPALDGSNRIATLGDITGDLTGFVTETGTQTLTNKTIDGAHVTGTTSFDVSETQYLKIERSGVGTARITAADDLALRATNDVIIYPGNDVSGHTGKAYIHWGDDNWNAYPEREIATLGSIQGTSDQINVDVANSQVTLSLPSYINIPDGELHLKKTEYWTGDNGSQYGIIAANNYSDAFSIASVGFPLQLESHTGDIQMLPDSNVVTIGTGYGELHLQKTEYWRDGTQQGVIAAQSDNSLRLTATDGQLQLESNGGDVRINPSSTVTWFNNNLNINGDGGVISTDNNSLHLNADNGVITTDAQEFHTTKVELWRGGDTSGSRLGIIVAHPSDGSLSIAASNQLVLEAHSGDINLYPDGNAYIGSSTDGNRIATISDVHSVAQGLYVLGSVRTATGSNIDINANASTPISGVTLVNGDRVLVNSQSTATENGIYIYSSASQTLVLSTNAEDAALKEGSYTLVTEGTYAAQGYIVTSVPYSNATIWTQFSAAGEYTFASGVYLDGNTVRVDYEGLETQLTSDGFVQSTDISNVARKYSVGITPAVPFADTTFTITHNLDALDVIARVYQTYGPDNGADVEVDIKRTSNNALTVSFATAPAFGETYTVVVIG